MRDIDLIITSLRQKRPEIKVSRMTKIHEADDDSFWWFTLPGFSKDVHIESADGNCPFWLETSDMPSGSHALKMSTPAAIVDCILEYLHSLEVAVAGHRTWRTQSPS